MSEVRHPAPARRDDRRLIGSSVAAVARRRRVALILVLASAAGLLVLPSPAPASHPISVTRALVYVKPDGVAVRLQVYVEDLLLFHNLQPNDRDFLEPDVIRDGIERHKRFLLERFVIRDVRGEALAGEVIAVRDLELPAEGIALGDLMSHKITFEMEYPLDAAPKFLTFSQHFPDADSLVPSEMTLGIKQQGSDAQRDLALTPDTPETIRFDWDKETLDPNASQQEWEAWAEEEQEETLGITSYSSVYSFLYIEDYEVRHEILIPLLTLEESVLIARADGAFLEVHEQQAAREQIQAFFLSGNPLAIDGVEVRPIVDRIDFFGVDFKDFARRAEPQRVSMASARVGIILRYSTKGPPSTVRLTWDRFNRFIWNVNTIVLAGDETQKVTLSRIGMNNAYEWTCPGRPTVPPLDSVLVQAMPARKWRIPVISLAVLGALAAGLLLMAWFGLARAYSWRMVLVASALVVALWPIARMEVPNPFAGAAGLTDDQMKAIFSSLHKNIYRAFDYRDEDAVYGALAKSVDGPLLRDLYLSIRRGLVIQEQGGAVSRIREVEILGCEAEEFRSAGLDDPRAFGYRCRWQVDGTVEHWGHIHQRVNEYEARFCVRPVDGAWKITDMQVMDERRVRSDTRPRKLN